MTDGYPNELFNSAAWAGVLHEAYGFDVEWSAEGLPLTLIDDLAGRRVVSLPFVDYLPIDTGRQFIELREDITARYPDTALIVKTRLPESEVPSDATVARTAVSHRLFPDGKEDTKFRRGIRKAGEAGLRVVRATDEAARERFAAMQHRQRQDKFGIICQPPSFFAAIHTAFMDRDNGFYLEAVTAEGEHAATLVVLRCGRGWFYKFGTSSPDHLSNYPNNLLIKHLVDGMREGEADFLDLGLSGSSDAYAGLRRFKDSTGAVSQPLHYLTNGLPLTTPKATEFKQFLGGITDTLVDLKAERRVVDPISERIYRFFA